MVDSSPTFSAIRAPGWLVRKNLGDLRAARRHGRQRFRQPVEAITLAGHRHDEPRLFGVRLDLAPQSADQHIDASVEGLELPVERCVQQRVPAQYATRQGDEDPQQRKLAAGQRNRLARLADKRAGVEIEDKAGKPLGRLPFAGKRSTLADTKSQTVPHARPSSPEVCILRRSKL